jgi:hypothetical protein
VLRVGPTDSVQALDLDQQHRPHQRPTWLRLNGAAISWSQRDRDQLPLAIARPPEAT